MTSLIDVIVQDHRDVERVFEELETGSGTPEQRKQLVDHVIADLVRHSVAEEQFMYPAARKATARGGEIVDHEIEEHAEAERVMAELEKCDPHSAEFEQRVEQLIDDVRHHVDEEERTLLPQLRDALSAEELQKLGDRVLAAKKAAPTRPHPNAPDTPPGNLITDPGAGIIDKVRDFLSGREA